MGIGGRFSSPSSHIQGQLPTGTMTGPALPLSFFLPQPPTLKWKERWVVQESKTHLRSQPLDEDLQL